MKRIKNGLLVIKQKLRIRSRIRRLWGTLLGVYAGFCYTYQHRIALVAGLPQSASGLFGEIIMSVPGYQNVHPLLEPLATKVLDQHLIDATVFKNIPKYGFYVLQCHANPTEDAFKSIHELNLTPIVSIRDPRDQAVSAYFERLRRPTNPWHSMYKNLSLEEGMKHSLQLTLDYYVPFIEGWLRFYEQNPGKCCLVRFEDFKQAPLMVAQKILTFLKIDFKESDIKKILDSSLKKHPPRARVQKENSLYIGGTTNNWRSHFSPSDVRAFQERTGSLLIALGYETNLNWGMNE